MTLNGIINQLADGQAAKRPSMVGYIYRKDITPAAQAEETMDAENAAPVVERKFALSMVERDGTETVFEDGDGETVLDLALLLDLAADDWEIGKRDDYERAREGKGRW